MRNWSRKLIKLKSGRVLPPPSEASKKWALNFLEWLKSKKYHSPNTLHRYLTVLRKIISWAEMWDKSIENLTYEDWLKIINEFGESDDQIQVVVKLVLKYLYEITDNEEYMKNYKKIRVQRKRRILPCVLTESDVFRLVESCGRIDFKLKVLVEVVYETGARVGEILNLKKKDVEFDDYGARLYIRRSKSDSRVVRVIMFASDLARLCDGLSADDFLFDREYNAYLRKIRKAWKLANLPETKRKFHVLRHTRATHLLKKRVFSETEMMKYFGWKTRDMIDIYTHLTMNDVEERYLSALIPNNTSSNKELEVRVCPRCGLPISNNFNYCPRCGQPLTLDSSYETLSKAKKKEDEIEETKKLIEKLLDLAMRQPDLIKRLLNQKDQEQ
mgnify:CR=1 FL=1